MKSGTAVSSPDMDATEYRRLREKLGTQQRVAELLGVSRRTIINREQGGHITEEAAMALRTLNGQSGPGE